MGMIRNIPALNHFEEEFKYYHFLEVCEERTLAKTFMKHYGQNFDGNEEELAKRVSSRRFGEKDYRGTDTFEEALRLGRDGWPEGVERLNKHLNRLKVDHLQAVSSSAYRVSRSFAGSRVNVPAAVSGNPKSMFRMDRKEGLSTGGHVRIYVQLGCPYNTTVDERFIYGAALAGLIDELEARHIRVELMGNLNLFLRGFRIPKRGSFNAVSCNVLVKSLDQPLDMDRLAFVLCNMAFVRRLGFSYIEQFAMCLSSLKDYGAPLSEVGPQTVPGVRIPMIDRFRGNRLWSPPLTLAGLFDKMKDKYQERIVEAVDVLKDGQVRFG